MQFWEICQKKLDKRSKTFRPMSKNFRKNYQFFQNRVSPQNVRTRVECISDNFAGKYSTECWKGFAQCDRMIKSIWPYFSKKPLKMILWMRWKQFSQNCQNVFVRSPKFFRYFLKTIRTATIFSTKLIFFQGFLWSCRIQFWQSCRRSFDKKLKKFAQ